MTEIKLRSENGKHIVTRGEKEISFYTLRIALLYIKLVKENKL